MLSKKQLKIMNIFKQNIFREYTFREIKQVLNEKSNNFSQLLIKKLIEEDIICERLIGTTKLYKLNLKNEKIYSLIELSSLVELSKIVLSSVNFIKVAVERHTKFYSIVIFGSYANKTTKTNSDLDVAIIINDNAKQKDIERAINSAELKSVLKIDYHVISYNELKEMLIADYENLGKEIAKKNMPILNCRIFYKILEEGVNNGAKIIS